MTYVMSVIFFLTLGNSCLRKKEFPKASYRLYFDILETYLRSIHSGVFTLEKRGKFGEKKSGIFPGATAR